MTGVQARSALASRASCRDRSIFFRALAMMLRTGVSMTRALEVLSKQVDAPALAQAAHRVAAQVASGVDLPRAMANESPVFSTYHVKLVQVGCNSGRLVSVLERLADQEEKSQATFLKLRSALIYPALVLVASLALALGLPLLLFRGLIQVIQDNGGTLPWMTRLVLFGSDVLRSPVFFLGVPAAAMAALQLGRSAWRQPALRLAITEQLLRCPGLGRVLRTAAICRFARALELLLSAGGPALQGLELAGEASSNPVLHGASRQAAELLKSGQSLAEALRNTGFFPKIFLQAVQVGQEHGQLPSSLVQAATLLELDLDSALETLQAAIEPLVMLVMGLVVGFILIATILPLLRVVESL